MKKENEMMSENSFVCCSESYYLRTSFHRTLVLRLLLSLMLSFFASFVYAEVDETLPANECTDCTAKHDNFDELFDSYMQSETYGYKRGEVLSDKIKNDMELRATKKILNSISAETKKEMTDALKKSIELMEGNDPNGVYYFPRQ